MEEIISGREVEFDDFDDVPNGAEDLNGNGRSMDLLGDVEMDVSVELGRIELPLGKVLQLAKGSVIELEKLAGEPVDILVNGQCIAQGEVVVIDEHFGVRIANLITTRQRIAKLQ
jgi:flagellar motor switch protein FliN/FliY